MCKRVGMDDSIQEACPEPLGSAVKNLLVRRLN
jgi:hypothetical protein